MGGLWSHLRQCWCSWAMLPPTATSWFMVLLQLGIILRSVGHVTTEGHVDVHCLCCHEDYDGVGGLCCGRGSCWWSLWQGLMPKTMWVSAVGANTRTSVEIQARAPADGKGQGNCFCNDINDCRLTAEKEHRRLLWQPIPSRPQKRMPRQKAIREKLKKIVIKMLKCSSPQVLALKGCGWGRTQFPLEVGYWEFDRAPLRIDNKDWTWFPLFWLGEGNKGGGGPGRAWMWVWWVHYVKFLNNETNIM